MKSRNSEVDVPKEDKSWVVQNVRISDLWDGLCDKITEIKEFE